MLLDMTRITLLRFAALMAVLLLPTPAAAQRLDLPTVAFASGATADWITTHRNMKYWREQNPLLRWIDHKPTAMVAIGASVDVAGYYAWRKITKNHPTWRAVGLYSAAGLRFYFAARHIRHRRKHLPGLLLAQQPH